MSVSPPRTRRDLGAPRSGARFRLLPARPHYDPEAFGRFLEALARFVGSARFFFLLFVAMVAWLAAEQRFVGFDLRVALLTLFFAGVGAFAAPLILIAQARQAERDRHDAEMDRRANARALADTEYMARELAVIRLSLGAMPTRDYLDERLEQLERDVAALRARVEGSGGHEGAGRRD